MVKPPHEGLSMNKKDLRSPLPLFDSMEYI